MDQSIPPQLKRPGTAARTVANPAASTHEVSQTGAAPTDPVLFRFFNELGSIEQLARNRFERALPHRLSFAQFSVLNQFVRLGGERSLVDLARGFQVTKPAMTKLVRKLQEAGFVSVRPNPADSRSKLVSITERGVNARHQAIMALAPSFGEMRRVIGEDSFEQALPFLTVLREWLERNS